MENLADFRRCPRVADRLAKLTRATCRLLRRTVKPLNGHIAFVSCHNTL
jgi:hypothetical protein